MEGHLRIARALTDLLENQVGVGKFKVGLDPLIGLIPGIGDVATFAISFYHVWIAIRLRIPQEKLIEMIANIVVDFFIGLLPLVGDVADAVYRSNSKNMKILEQYAKNVIEGEVV